MCVDVIHDQYCFYISGICRLCLLDRYFVDGQKDAWVHCASIIKEGDIDGLDTFGAFGIKDGQGGWR